MEAVVSSARTSLQSSPGAQAVVLAWWRDWHERVWLPLQVPPRAVYQEASRLALEDTGRAVGSVSRLLYLVGRPVAVALWWLGQWACRLFWRFVIVEGLSVQGWTYLVQSSRNAWRWQRSLTPTQVALEGAVLASLWQVYLVWRILKQTRLIRRASLFAAKCQRRALESYQTGVNRIASGSLWLAVMTPHVLFGVGVSAFGLLFPNTLRFLATQTGLTSLLALWIPVVATLQLLNDMAMQDEAKQEEAANRQETTTTPLKTPVKRKKQTSLAATPSPMTPGFFPMTTPTTAPRRKRRRSSFLTPFLSRNADPEEEAEDLELPERVTYWFDYWMVHATLQAGKKLVKILPLVSTLVVGTPWLDKGLLQLELVFYVWLYVMPWLELPLPAKAPEGKPLALLAPVAGQCAGRMVQCTNVFTDAWWQAWPVRYTELVLQVSTLVGLTSRPTADALKQLVQTGQSLLLPAMSLFLPMGAAYGLLFVQYILPLAHAFKVQPAHLEYSPKAAVQLQFWILHAAGTPLVRQLQAWFWWFPALSILLFCLWLYLALESTVTRWYGMVQTDLRLVGLLAQHDHLRNDDMGETHTGRFVSWAVSKLPKAAEHSDEPSVPTRPATAAPKPTVVESAVVETKTEEAIVETKTEETIIEAPIKTDAIIETKESNRPEPTLVASEEEPVKPLRRSARRRKSPTND